MSVRLNVEDYRSHARRSLPKFVFDYLEGGAEGESTLHANRTDLEALRLTTRCLRDTRDIDPSIEVFGQKWAMPYAIAPIGLCGLFRPDGDVMMSRAALGAGIPHVLSTASNSRLETLPAGNPLQWLQLYVMSQRSIAEQVVRRARAQGFGALVLTVDVPVSGARERDVRNQFKVPFKPTARLALDVLQRPGWLWRLAKGGSPQFANLVDGDEKPSAQTQAMLLSREMDRSLDWQSLQWLRELWDGPLLIKGILHPDDARMALAHGADGLIVSNHGGRQLDGAVSSISALQPILDAVADRIPVFVDGGFRRASHVVKALALGARGVFLGRPMAYGLASGGEAGVASVIDLLRHELRRNMILMGANTIADITRDHLAPNQPVFSRFDTCHEQTPRPPAHSF
ncbi:alpha-hydroxy acid oxidase [Comamonadaceae bacterium PP-2]